MCIIEAGYELGTTELEPVASNRLTRFCSDVEFNQTNFHSFADIQVVVNPTWNDFNPPPNNIIHGATGAWVENINGTHFRACCKTSYVQDHVGDKCSINYIVYQKNLKYQTEGKMVAGDAVVLPDFASASGCGNVTDLVVSAFGSCRSSSYFSNELLAYIVPNISSESLLVSNVSLFLTFNFRIPNDLSQL